MIKQLVPLALSVNTITLMWLVGNKSALGWLLGLAGQVGWFAFIILFEAWGLLPLAVALTVVYARNLHKWWKQAKDDVSLSGDLACSECGLLYRDPGWIDATIPDRVWDEICPEGGVLCLTCIARRLEEAGHVNVPVYLGSGPFIPALNPRESHDPEPA